ncbi:cysteine proteinase [Coccomyxa subellipsoidea C-169]|uniref:Cysteine proteinase n=1 Tax=Coccomyxa subellipsoidea (strain C-169) TaxID=574566 RepID=I0YV65_COCSC|nr:cysteine proteinase [Coccomyxa subellipsoidea C-169]EIE22284.1 cysteine proteinase [Coccomyxa subellipsoidea C-169]|eukprot:XP_005646828.1 cysteine proteinase [Coccomyxa subellipsoidea C-169]
MGKKSAKPTSVASQRPKSDQKERKRSSYSSGDIVAELQRWNLRIAQVKDDGNCFFRAAADQLEGASGDHMALRQKVVTFIRSHVDDFEPYMEDGETLDRYCKRMSEDGTWAGYQEQVALARLCSVAIRVYQAGQPVWTIKPEYPDFPQDSPAIHVSYHDGEHYNSVRRADDHTSGPPLPIAIAERLPTSAEKAAARSWGPAQEELVMRGTGCYDDPAAVQQALEAAHGNPDQAIEILIEQLASAAVPSSEGQGRRIEQAGPQNAKEKKSKLQVAVGKKPARNRECPCGSRKRYKNCCGPSDAAAARRQAKGSVEEPSVQGMPAIYV